MCQGSEKEMREIIQLVQNKAIAKMVMQLRGMAGEKALIGDLATTLAEDPEFAPWPGERFVTASAIRVIKDLRDRDESEVERDEASQRLFDCMAEDKQAVFVEGTYIEDDAVDYIKYLRSKIQDLEGQIKELSNTKPAAGYEMVTQFGAGKFDRLAHVDGCKCNALHAEKLRPENWWIS